MVQMARRNRSGEVSNSRPAILMLNARGVGIGWKEVEWCPMVADYAVELEPSAIQDPEKGLYYPRDIRVGVNNHHNLWINPITRKPSKIDDHYNGVSCRFWVEYIPSKQNWSDGLSRNGVKDAFVNKHAIPCTVVGIPGNIWQGTATDAWQFAKRCV